MAQYLSSGLSLESSRDTSAASLVPYPYHHYQQPPITSPSPQGPNTFELIPHRIFVGGFATATQEADLRSFFEKFGAIREVKIIRNPDGHSKGYAFITFETDEEAQRVRQQPPDNLEFNGRRLNVGPAMRRISQTTRLSDLSVVTPQSPQVLYSPGPGYAYPGNGFTVVPVDVGQAPGQIIPLMVPSQPPPYASHYPSPYNYSPNRVNQSFHQSRLVVPPGSGNNVGSTPVQQENQTAASGQSDNSKLLGTRSPGKTPQAQANTGQGQQQAPVYASNTPLPPSGQPLTPITPSLPQQPAGGYRWHQMPSTPLHPYIQSPLYSYQYPQQTFVYQYPPVDMTHYSQMYPNQTYFPSPDAGYSGLEASPDNKYPYGSHRSPRKSAAVSLVSQMNQLAINNGNSTYGGPVRGSPGQMSPYKGTTGGGSGVGKSMGGATSSKSAAGPTPPLTPIGLAKSIPVATTPARPQ